MVKSAKFKLTGREKSELFGEGIVTIILLILLNMSIYVILSQLIATNPGLKNGIFQIKMSLKFGPNDFQIWSWGWLFVVLMAIIDCFIVYWRLMRRYSQMQVRHIIAELHYIAAGHFDHRIPFTLKGQTQRIVASVNALVDSTINSMEEERRIERSKDELITNVSHDIRTPLTSIIGYLGLLKTGNVAPGDQAKYINIAYTKAEQMKSLANDLLEYTTLKSSSTKLNLAPLHIYSMLEQVEAGFELEAEKKGIKFTIESRPRDLTIKADPEKLVRVYNNLINNAFKYGTGATEIKLITNLVNKQEVELRIENNGAKIPKDSLKKIFERFYRVEGSRNVKTGGTGLGLSITKGVVDLHHGTIRCESDDSWTSFIIRLPLDPDKAKTNR